MTKRLVYLFDGTGQSLEGERSAIAHIAATLPRDKHKVYYAPGVGTYGNFIRRAYQSLFAPPAADGDVGMIIKAALAHVKKHYKSGKGGSPDIWVFGYSRGAAIARRFCYLLQGKAWVGHLGCFDTVASLGLPALRKGEVPASDVKFVNANVAGNVMSAKHALAMDETRAPFAPTQFNKNKVVEEMWFPGVHSDIGGCNKNDVGGEVLQWLAPKDGFEYFLSAIGRVSPREPRSYRVSYDKSGVFRHQRLLCQWQDNTPICKGEEFAPNVSDYSLGHVKEYDKDYRTSAILPTDFANIKNNWGNWTYDQDIFGICRGGK